MGKKLWLYVCMIALASCGCVEKDDSCPYTELFSNLPGLIIGG